MHGRLQNFKTEKFLKNRKTRAPRARLQRMSRKKQAERYKILELSHTVIPMLFEAYTGHRIYRYNLVEVVGPPINDYVAIAGFNTLKEAKAYRRWRIQEDRRKHE